MVIGEISLHNITISYTWTVMEWYPLQNSSISMMHDHSAPNNCLGCPSCLCRGIHSAVIARLDLRQVLFPQITHSALQVNLGCPGRLVRMCSGTLVGENPVTHNIVWILVVILQNHHTLNLKPFVKNLCYQGLGDVYTNPMMPGDPVRGSDWFHGGKGNLQHLEP